MLNRVHTMLVAFLLMPLGAMAQDVVVAPCTGWLATVDEATQHIVLSWHPSADSAAMGYHICTGAPRCLDYDTVFGRLDTTYVCLDHSPLEAHTYRLHVFDSAYNVSSLTETFGNMVLTVDVPDCDPSVAISWTPYPGMPGGVTGYRLMAMFEPHHSEYTTLRTFTADDPLVYSYELPTWVTYAHFKVVTSDPSGELVSQSNVVSVERRTIDTAAFVDITAIAYDGPSASVQLEFNVDTAYHGADHYTLWRSIDHSPWKVLATGNWSRYADTDINLYDSLYCYQLSVFDACGLNEKFSSTACTVVPDPPEPDMSVPNIIIAGDPANGAFLPSVEGLAGDVYELSVFDRHGLLLFSTTDPAEAWRPAPSTPQGAYVYRLRVRYVDGIIQSYIGTILVLK